MPTFWPTKRFASILPIFFIFDFFFNELVNEMYEIRRIRDHFQTIVLKIRFHSTKFGDKKL